MWKVCKGRKEVWCERCVWGEKINITKCERYVRGEKKYDVKDM